MTSFGLTSDQSKIGERESPSTHANSEQNYGSPTSSYKEDDSMSESGAEKDPRPSKKRKEEGTETPVQRGIKRIRKTHNNNYRLLLNAEIETATSYIGLPDHDVLRGSQIGMSLWSSEEKNVFFDALTRLGRHDIKGIASQVGTKSLPEVSFYLQCLKRGFWEHHVTARHLDAIDDTDLPAATEIDTECCDALDEAARLVEHHQQRYEELDEQKRWPALWNVDRDIAFWIENDLDTDNRFLMRKEDRTPEFDLLRLDNWLELSEEVFMNNSSKAGANWRDVLEDQEMPSLLRQAIKDFHTLAVSFLRRLLQTTMYYVMSRVRAADSLQAKLKPIIRPSDVHAACDILGLKTNSKEFWACAPRRLGLDICENLRVTGYKRKREVKHLSYDEVERRLRIGQKNNRHGSSTAEEHDSVDTEGRTNTRASSQIYSTSDHESDAEVVTMVTEAKSSGNPKLEAGSEVDSGALSSSVSSEAGESSDASDDELKYLHTRQARVLKPHILRREREKAQAAHVDALDKQASLEEEHRLWAVLKKQPSSVVDPSSIELPPKPIKQRLRVEDMVDWKDRVEYWSEWETERSRVSEQDFARNAEKKENDLPSHISATYLEQEALDSTRPETVPAASQKIQVPKKTSNLPSPLKRRPHSSRHRSIPQAMPGMVPTGTALVFSDAEGPSNSRVSARHGLDEDDDEDDDKDYEG
ncbi:MAG: hypothetical protein M4579_001692 [Chaenotheca gracillima]|nr:MAG: hypothetical protein M4579_001692 [Chaenotheca gracillima]